MGYKYINTKTYEIIEDLDFFDVDEKIAETISILNKKGYKTLYSCQGHNYKNIYKLTAEINFLEEVKKEPNCFIASIRENDFDYYCEAEISSVYILFNGHYDFVELPEGFNYETAQEQKERDNSLNLTEEMKKDFTYGDKISFTMLFFKEGNIRKTDEEVESEIDYLNSILLNWAKKLPILSEDNEYSNTMKR